MWYDGPDALAAPLNLPIREPAPRAAAGLIPFIPTTRTHPCPHPSPEITLKPNEKGGDTCRASSAWR